MKLIQREGNSGLVEQGGVQTRISLDLLDDVQPGQWVIVHAGFAIESMDEDMALETLGWIEEALGE